MAGRFRRLIERTVFAGLRRGAPRGESDPLYLSNRTWSHWLVLGLKIGIPLALLAGGMAWLFESGRLAPGPPKYELTPAQVAQQSRFPDLRDVRVETNRDVEVLEVSIDRSGPIAVAGVIRNNTSHTIHSVEISLNVADAAGSQLSRQSAQVRNLAPQSLTRFRMPIPNPTATQAIVREIRTQ